MKIITDRMQLFVFGSEVREIEKITNVYSSIHTCI